MPLPVQMRQIEMDGAGAPEVMKVGTGTFPSQNPTKS